MSRPAAALSSELLVRKGHARPLVEYEPGDLLPSVQWPPRPAVDPIAEPLALDEVPERRRPLPRLFDFQRLWHAGGRRWSLPTAMLLSGLAMILVVAAGPRGIAGNDGASAIVSVRPPGPTPVTWIDAGHRAAIGEVGAWRGPVRSVADR